MAKTFRGLTKAQDRAFGLLAINQNPLCTKKTIQALLDKGLIESRKRMMYFKDGLPPMEVTDYVVPINIHMEWCLWCADQPENKEN